MKNVLRALGYLKKYWNIVLGALFSMLVISTGSLVSPQLLRILIDEGIGSLDLRKVIQVSAILVGIAILMGIFNFLQSYWAEVASQGVAYDLRNSIFEKLQKLSFSYHDRAQTGKLMTRMTSDVEIVRMFVSQGLLSLLSSILVLTGTLVIMFVMNWRLSIILVAIIPIVLTLFILMISRISPIAMAVQQKLAALNTILQENLAGMRVVKAFAREPFETQRYLDQNQDLLQENINLIRLYSTIFPLIFFFANLGIVAVVWFGGLQVIRDQLTLGELVAFIGYLGYMLLPVFMLGMLSSMLSRAIASAKRVFEVIDAQSEIVQKPDAVPLPPLKGEVKFRRVRFRYTGGEEDVIQNISFQAEPGQTIAILGQTGAGKSSIINLIPRFYDVSSGKITMDGYDLRDVTLDSLRSQIGIVLQESSLFSGTIRENIAYGRPDARIEDIIEAAKAAQAHDFIEAYPQGYDTRVGERGVGLSGGQKQRIAIARALLVEPRILILDDSTSSVDAETEYFIQQALEKLMEGRTSFVIAQRISTVRKADKILLLGDGKLVAEGTHEELLQSSELYAEILETQFADRSELIAAVEEGISK